jgi:hypothetical protein
MIEVLRGVRVNHSAGGQMWYIEAMKMMLLALLLTPDGRRR